MNEPKGSGVTFMIAEIDEGLTILEIQPGEVPEDVAAREDATLLDEGPFETYEQAEDALMQLEEADEDRI